MQAIKFVPNHKEEHQFASVVRKRVNDYFKQKNISQKGNLTLVMQTIVNLCLYIVPFIVLLTVHVNVWIAAAMTAVMGIGIAGVGMCVMHDAVHGSYSDKTWVNKLFGSTLYLLGGNVFNWKMQHNVFHHAFTNIDGVDEDIASRGVLRMADHSPLKKIHHYQYIHAFF
ncbi:MAG TPA: fatty acid desaturase, partial [Bacteroidia bacterium]|nr:fatty acid desaturase [Bacteroidia bacterium]